MIIAEIGLNHLGSFELAKRYVNFLCSTDVDGISFQVREKEFYDREEKKNLSLEAKEYIELRSMVKDGGKKFGVALADASKISFFKDLDTDFYKIIRNDMENDFLVRNLLNTGNKVIVSTGLSSEKEMSLFVDKHSNYKNFTFNHTQLSYDAADCNLSAITRLKETYGVPISFGSHCSNYNVLYMSLCYEPSDVLFYVKMSDTVVYPDDKHAVCLGDVADLAANLTLLSTAVGDGVKQKIENKIVGMKI